MLPSKIGLRHHTSMPTLRERHRFAADPDRLGSGDAYSADIDINTKDVGGLAILPYTDDLQLCYDPHDTAQNDLACTTEQGDVEGLVELDEEDGDDDEEWVPRNALKVQVLRGPEQNRPSTRNICECGPKTATGY